MSRVVIELEVRRFGDSLGVVLPEAVTNRLRAEEGQSLYLIEAPDGSYRLTQYDPSLDAKMCQVENIAGRYRNTLHVLAK
jgi:antitoxin component of MazEF toxin-antitoxin module